jgi:hypothetical protein
MFFPEEDPSFERLWEYRPLGPEFSLIPTQESWPYDIAWSLAGMASMAAWTRYTGMGVAANTFFGGIFYPTATTALTRSASHTFGASPSFTTGFLTRTVPQVARVAGAPAVLAGVPTALYFANEAVIESAPEEEQAGYWQMFSQALTGTGFGVGGADVTGL